MSDALVGDTLERLRLTLAEQYAVIRELGRGGMAVVYLAEDVRHGRQVAIKVLLPELAASLGGDRFLREIRVAAKLQHPHILPLFDSGSADGLLYYVMPFVEGESLRDKLNREKQFEIGEAIRLAGEVADALHYAHTQGIVHRDIKPENVMLSGGHALVADFGIAKAVSAAGGERLTQTGMAIGTPYYMSPEQAMGEGMDGRADQYSLACVLYELLAGQPPFTGPTPMAVLARHSLEKVPSLQIVRHSIPAGVELVVLRALEKVAADRYPTMGEFANELRSAEIERISTRTGARPLPTRDLPVSPVAEKRVRRKRLAMLAGVAIAAIAAAAGTFLWVRRGSEPAPVGATGPDPRRIAVLYFQSRGGSDSLRYLADGLTEGLINELSRVAGLQVISRNGVGLYRETAVPPDSIARALKVGTLVTGTLGGLGDRLRVNIALVNAATGTEIGSKNIEEPRAEILSLQEELTKEVALFLRQQLGQEVRLEASRLGTRNRAAWELLQKAQQEVKAAEPLIAAGDTGAAKRQFGRADTLLAQAEAADPKWATPPAQRSWVAYRQSRLAGSFDRAYYSEWIDKGLAHAERALAIKPDDPDALEARGTLRYWRFLLNLEPGAQASAKLAADAEKDLRAAVEANPTQASALTSLSHLLAGRHELAEAKLASLRAYESDPYLTNADVTLWRLTSISSDLEDAVEAKRWCDEGRSRFPDDPRFAECQVLVFSIPGVKPDVAHAWKMADEYVKLSPPALREYRKREAQMMVALALARAGLKDSARGVALRARADASLDPTRELANWEAWVRTLVGDRDEAFQLLALYLSANPQERATHSETTSWVRELQSDPRWKSLMGSH
ncbi:MAG TPA: protein kinase [Gemmatimonadales bacterium]|nr:protein kinase [Gemmatimonadales bacterium]